MRWRFLPKNKVHRVLPSLLKIRRRGGWGGWGNTSLMILKSEAEKQTFLKDCFFRIVIIPHLGEHLISWKILGLGTHTVEAIVFIIKSLKLALWIIKLRKKRVQHNKDIKFWIMLLLGPKSLKHHRKHLSCFTNFRRTILIFYNWRYILKSVTYDHIGSSSDTDLCRHNRKWKVLRTL